MKKIKIISFIVIAMMIFNVIAITCISNAVENIVKASASNPTKIIQFDAINAAYGSEEHNQYAEKILVDITKVKELGEEVILFDGEGANGEEDFSAFVDNRANQNDTNILNKYHTLHFAKITSVDEHSIYIGTKKFLQQKVGKLSDFSMQLIITGNNGKKFTSTISDSQNGINTFGNQYEEFGKDGEKKIITELGGTYNPTEEQAGKHINYFYDSLDKLAKSVNYVFNVNGKKYYLVFGYNANSEDNKEENGCYKINAYLITDKSMDVVDEFDTELTYEAYIGNKNVGGTNDNGTFKPNYDKENVKKDADVTATITSKTDEEIVAVDDVALKTDGSENEKGWYYPALDNKKIIAKQYKFDKYNNSKANGIVKEDVVLTGSKDNKDEQTVSIKWPFRIIDVVYEPQKPTKDTKEVKVTIETNLPMDPNKVPEGWAIVPDTDNHKITKTFKNGEKINTDVTVYQNGTGDSDKTNVKIDWPADNTVAPTRSPNTGETFTILVVIGIAIFSAVIARKKFKSKK